MSVVPLTLTYTDSPRGRAFINAFLELGIFPEEIIIFGKTYTFSEEFENEAQKYNYSDFFDWKKTIDSLCCAENKIFHVDTNSINDQKMKQCLQKTKSDHVLFSGGGIVSKEILSINKSLIHVHPGYIPFFRGSTCFYYSLLEEGTFGATAFLMNEQIDRGEALVRKKFTINMPITFEQLNFLDNILDPYIRMKTLSNVLSMFTGTKELQCIEIENNTNKADYYVMHPVLRFLCMKKIASLYDATLPTGIMEI